MPSSCSAYTYTLKVTDSESTHLYSWVCRPQLTLWVNMRLREKECREQGMIDNSNSLSHLSMYTCTMIINSMFITLQSNLEPAKHSFEQKYSLALICLIHLVSLINTLSIGFDVIINCPQIPVAQVCISCAFHT